MITLLVIIIVLLIVIAARLNKVIELLTSQDTIDIVSPFGFRPNDEYDDEMED